MLKNAIATGALVASALVIPVTFSALPANAAAASQGVGSESTTTNAADCWWREGCKYCKQHGETRRVTCERSRRGHESREHWESRDHRGHEYRNHEYRNHEQYRRH
ncbi:hypothetical protein [Microtetraspora niveoalba]|uniref:hypothetical protein n=1 Tax=Microtetraspora niveoalba TaxID=46175 RepID=UPI000A50CF40|nr:hypothetical protein [Microtetraspora niveoalba]